MTQILRETHLECCCIKVVVKSKETLHIRAATTGMNTRNKFILPQLLCFKRKPTGTPLINTGSKLFRVTGSLDKGFEKRRETEFTENIKANLTN